MTNYMQSIDAIKQLLDSESIDYQEIPFEPNMSLVQACEESGTPIENVVRAILFNNGTDAFITLVQINNILNIEELKEKLARDVVPAGLTTEPPETFPFEKDPQSGLVMDQGLQTIDDFYFPIDAENHFIKVSKQQFLQLKQAPKILEFTVPLIDVLQMDCDDGLNFNKKRIIDKIENIAGLPAMPEMGLRILQISRDPNTDAKDLSKVIEVDPSLSAQIMSYSSSAFYGYQGDIVSVREAISRVLGFELVANLALGIALGKEFKITNEGPLGLSAFWRHAVYSSALCEKLAKSLPRSKGLKPGLAYLCGLLHNFGHLLFGHIYSPGFELLNASVVANPDIDIKLLERFNLGVTHDEIGAALLENWQMPAETINTARWHHDETYNGECSDYVHLIQLVDNLLKRQDIGDASSSILSQHARESLEVTEDFVISSASSLLDSCAELDNIANKLAT